MSLGVLVVFVELSARSAEEGGSCSYAADPENVEEARYVRMSYTPVTDDWLRAVLESRPKVGSPRFHRVVSAKFYAVYEELLERREAEAAERKAEVLAHKVEAEEKPVLPAWAYERAAKNKVYLTPSLPRSFFSNGTVFVDMEFHVIDANALTGAKRYFPVIVNYEEALQEFHRQQTSEAIESMPS